MHYKLSISPFIRTLAIISLLIGVAGGLTYAALQSQSKLTDSSITTATANLLIGRDTTNYSSTQAGYAFMNLIPGGTLTPNGGHPVYIKNAGGTPLNLKLAVSSIPTNANNVDLSKVMVHLNATPTGETQTFTLKSLVDSNATGGTPISLVAVLFKDQVYPLTLQVSMAKDAFEGQSAAIGAIDFVITGIATS